MNADKRKWGMDWLELMRVPNFLSVPGDPLAGFALASMGQADVQWLRVIPVVLVSLLLYAAGMIWNDVADYSEDCRDRPQRPLPSGRVGRGRAVAAGVGLAVAAVGLAAATGIWTLAVALVLLSLVLAYDFGRGGDAVWRRWVGFFNMGACRGVSLLLGAAAALPPAEWSAVVIAAAVGIGLYIVFVEVVSVDEVKQSFLSQHVGLLIRFLIVIQAGLSLFAGGGGVWVAPVILAGWPLAGWLGRRFYAS